MALSTETTDGGGPTWEVLLNDRNMWLYGIDSAGKNNIWVAADYGEILHSSDMVVITGLPRYPGRDSHLTNGESRLEGNFSPGEQ